MRVRNVLFAIGVWLAIWGCTKIDYIGESYPPTTSPDMYFSEADITLAYKVMGHLVATAPDLVSAEKMQKKIMEKARQNGADGVIIEGLERYKSGESTNYSETTQQKGKKTVTSGSSSTSTEEKKEIRATFIKYKR